MQKFTKRWCLISGVTHLAVTEKYSAKEEERIIDVNQGKPNRRFCKEWKNICDHHNALANIRRIWIRVRVQYVLVIRLLTVNLGVITIDLSCTPRA